VLPVNLCSTIANSIIGTIQYASVYIAGRIHTSIAPSSSLKHHYCPVLLQSTTFIYHILVLLPIMRFSTIAATALCLGYNAMAISLPEREALPLLSEETQSEYDAQALFKPFFIPY
jgi:hypothetical protein